MKDELLQQVLNHYASSRDFNGYFVGGSAEDAVRSAAVELVRDGMLQVVSEKDFYNPHIRPWPSRRTADQQVASIEALTPDANGVCLYPTPLALKKYRTTKRYPGQPFRHEMAKGRGALELAYFAFEVLEQYRNDPKFSFTFHDFGVYVSISDEAYLDQDEPDDDKTRMEHVGFAYDLSNYKHDDPESPVIRRVCAFYGDLANLTPTHQQRWRTYQVPEDGLKPHPIWWMRQMGEWTDGLGPFERLFFEMKALSELHERAFGVPLFRTTDRPSDFGWILRPSQYEWDNFIHQLDKLLSENLRHDALDETGVPRTNEEGKHIGSLNRLAAVLTSHGLPDDPARDVLKPLREIRQARQGPAHALRKNITDKTFVHKQIHLLEQVNISLNKLRTFWQAHPANEDWRPEYEFDRNYRI